MGAPFAGSGNPEDDVLPFYAGWTLLGMALGGAIYALTAAILAGERFSAAGEQQPPAPQPPVSVLKPLRGAEPGLFEALGSTLQQDYSGQMQLVCGIQDENDPAAAVVGRLQNEFPDQCIVIVADPRRHGLNQKVSNLINMIHH